MTTRSGWPQEFEAEMARHVDELHRRMERRTGRSGEAVAVRFVRQRPRSRRSDCRIHRARRPEESRFRVPALRSAEGVNHDDTTTTVADHGPRPAATTSLIPGLGVGVLLANGAQAALFRLDDGTVRAVCNIDPFFRAAVTVEVDRRRPRRPALAVISPLQKQAFALDDGSCLDDPDVSGAGVPDPDHGRRLRADRPTAPTRASPEPATRVLGGRPPTGSRV